MRCHLVQRPDSLISPVDITRPEQSETFEMKCMMHAIAGDGDRTEGVGIRDEVQEEEENETPVEGERNRGALVPFARVMSEEISGESDREYNPEEEYGTEEEDGWGGSGQTSTQGSDYFADIPAPGFKKPRSARICKASSRALVKAEDTSTARHKSKGGKKEQGQDQKIEMRYAC